MRKERADQGIKGREVLNKSSNGIENESENSFKCLKESTNEKMWVNSFMTVKCEEEYYPVVVTKNSKSGFQMSAREVACYFGNGLKNEMRFSIKISISKNVSIFLVKKNSIGVYSVTEILTYLQFETK